MLEIHFGSEQDTLRTFVTVLEQITIGADPGCTLQLTGDVAPLHCRLWRHEGRWVVTPEAPLAVNGVAIDQPAYVGFGDRLQLGSVALLLKPMVAEAVEEDLIAGAREDAVGRSVYADWLEERGQWDRAEFLRLTLAAQDLTPEHPRFADTTIRIQKLARCLDQGWRMQISSSEVEGCKELRREFTCNMTWDRLGPTTDPLVRSCGACRSNVYYCRTEDEAARHSRDGSCVVLDLGVDRNTLRARSRAPSNPAFVHPPGMYVMPSQVQYPQRPCPQCQAIVPAGFRFCSSCGTPS
jgi:uncharacterized protein (TIGR02996 family)